MAPQIDEGLEPQKRRRRLIILLFFLGLILALVWTFRAVLTPFLVALFAAYLIDPVVERMAPFRIGGRFSLGRAGSIAGIPELGKQMRQAREELPELRATIEERIQQVAQQVREWTGEEDARDEPREIDAPREPTRSRFHLKGPGRAAIEAEIVERTDTQVVFRVGDGFDVLDLSRVDHEERIHEADEDVTFKQLIRSGIDGFVRNLDEVLRMAYSVVVTLLQTLYMVVLIMMITAFIVIDRQRIVHFFQTVPPERYQARYKQLTFYLDRGLAGVIRGQLIICGVNGILTWIGLALLGVRFAGLMGIIAGVFSLIPIFGTILSSIPIVLLAWGGGGFHSGVLALLWILLIHFVEANFLNPKIMGSASKIHPVVVIFALIAGEHAYGIVGALLAVPTASLVQSSFRFYVIDRQNEVLDPSSGER